jgi:hypothetical protein
VTPCSWFGRAKERPACQLVSGVRRLVFANQRVARILTRSIPELHQTSLSATSQNWTAAGRARECHVWPRSVVHSTAALPVDADVPESSERTNPTSSERNLTAFTSRLAPRRAPTRLTVHVFPPSVLSRSALSALVVPVFQSTSHPCCWSTKKRSCGLPCEFPGNDASHQLPPPSVVRKRRGGRTCVSVAMPPSHPTLRLEVMPHRKKRCRIQNFGAAQEKAVSHNFFVSTSRHRGMPHRKKQCRIQNLVSHSFFVSTSGHRVVRHGKKWCRTAFSTRVDTRVMPHSRGMIHYFIGVISIPVAARRHPLL